MLYLGGTKQMKNAEIMVEFIDSVKRSVTELFEGNICECKSSIYIKEDPRYIDSKMYLFPCKKSEMFGAESVAAELHYAYTPEGLDGERTWKMFFSFYDRKRERKICMIELHGKEIIEIVTDDEALKEHGLYEFVNELINTILDMSIGK